MTVLVKDKQDEARNTYFASNSSRNTGLALQYGLGLAERLFLTVGARHDFNDRFDDADTYRLTAAYLGQLPAPACTPVTARRSKIRR